MPTPKKGARLGGSPAHQKLILSNLAAQLIEHRAITTTEAKAKALRPMYMWDRLYLGGGNSKRITASNLRLMGDDVIVVPNDAGIIGGVRAWEL